VGSRPSRNGYPDGVSSRGFAFVSVVFEAECPLLWLQARSMAAYLPDDLVAEVIVIDNSRRPMPARFTQQLLDAYGPLSERVRVLRPRDICALPRTAGYRSQQILKLCVADQISSPRYVVLDAKNHFVAPVERDLFEAPDGRARISTTSYGSHALRPQLEHVFQYLGLDATPYLESFATTVPPFVLDKDVVRSLIDGIERRSGRTFPEEFVAHRLTEFFLYAGWIVASAGSLDDNYELQQQRRPYIWLSTANREGVERAIRAATDAGAAVFAVHRLALARLDGDSAHALAKFWASRRLFSSPANAERFVCGYRTFHRHVVRRERWRQLPQRATRVPRYLGKKLGAFGHFD